AAMEHAVTPLKKLLPPDCLDAAFVIGLLEPPLSITATVAEVRSGMWRRNGLPMAQLTDVYCSVHWSTLGRDLDIFLMQCCAALLPGATFLRLVQRAFKLHGYLLPGSDPPVDEYRFAP
ncbi:hypothetical protein CYMTET_34887, partial [Cymbomonas tetramitiformis]